MIVEFIKITSKQQRNAILRAGGGIVNTFEALKWEKKEKCGAKH